MESRPALSTDDVIDVLATFYGLRVTQQTTLNSYDDVNIHVHVENNADSKFISDVANDGYVLKVLNSVDSKKTSFIEANHAAIDCVWNSGISTSRPVLNKEGQAFSINTFQTANGKGDFLVRLFVYVPGEVLEGKPYSAKLCFQVGQLAGKLDTALKGFSHPGLLDHSRHWNLKEVANLPRLLHYIEDKIHRKLAEDATTQFISNVLGQSDKLQKGVIHGDLNEGNILVKVNLEAVGDNYDICGVLDFGDLVDEFHVYEVAIAMAYIMLESKDGLEPINAGGHVLAGYLSELNLPPVDCSVLKECVCGRLVQSLTYGAYAHRLDPTNTYCLKTAKVGWSLLTQIMNMTKKDLYKTWNHVLKCYNVKEIECT